MNRMLLMKIHALIAAFMLPAAIMFLLTGALYTWGVKGSYSNDVYEISLKSPMPSNIETLTVLTERELKKLSIEYPEGKPKLKVYGSHFLLEWTGSSKDVILEPAAEANVAKLTVKNTSWYRNFVQLHKAKGGDIFKVYAAVFALALALLLLSGFIMAWQTPKLKAITLITSLAGFCSFILVVLLS